MTPPEDGGVSWAWILDHAWLAIVGLLGLVWSQNKETIREHKKQSEKALAEHKEMNQKMHGATQEELSLHRGYFAKVFDEIKEGRQETNEHLMSMQRENAAGRESLMRAIYDGLNQKADK